MRSLGGIHTPPTLAPSGGDGIVAAMATDSRELRLEAKVEAEARARIPVSTLLWEFETGDPVLSSPAKDHDPVFQGE